MTQFLRIASSLGLIGYVGFLVLLSGLSHMSDSATDPGAGPTAVYFLVPIGYFAFCFASASSRFRGKPLLVAGVVAHLAILPLVIVSLLNGVRVMAVVALGMAAAWICMYIEKETPDEG